VFLAGASLCATVTAAAAPGPPPSATTWQTVGVWRQPEGLPQNGIRAILQTRDGYLWLGTNGGLTRFDGNRFLTFDDRDRTQLRENEVWALLEAHDGTLWIGTYGGGLSRYKDGRFSVLTTDDGLANDSISSLAEDATGRLWIGTDGGVSWLENGAFHKLTVADGLVEDKIRALYVDTDGSLWIGMIGGGVNHVRDGKVTTETLDPLPHEEVRAFRRARDGALWVATFSGLYRQTGGRWTRFTDQDGLLSSRIHDVYEDPDGRLWIATDDGLHEYLAGRFVRRPIAHALWLQPDLTRVHMDREGSLWVGSLSQGLVCLRPTQFLTWTTEDGLAWNYVSSVLQDGRGDIWIGTNKGLSVLRDGRLRAHALSHTALPNVTSMALEADGHLLIGTKSGVYRVEGGALTPLVKDVYARVIYCDGTGAVWIGSDNNGLVRWERGQVRTYRKADGLPDDAVRALAEDKDGVLWIGTRGGGLSRFSEDGFKSYGRKDGLPCDYVHSIHRDGETLWLSTRQGVVRFKDGRFGTITAGNGLYSSFVYEFVDDGPALWMSCSRGIFRVLKKDLNDVADGTRTTLTYEAYGLEHGLGGIVGTVGHHPGGWRSTDGRIWFATANGLAGITPVRPPVNEVIPPVHIEEVEADQQRVDLGSPIALTPGRGDLTFRYTALSFLQPEQVHFKYRLEGYDPDWQDAGNRRVAYYTNISPGHYTFRVIAANSDGKWNDEGASVALSLAPHFHQTWWFVAACGLALGLAVVGTHRFRVRTMAARQARLEALVDERTRELKDATTALDMANHDLEQRVASGIEALREAERMAAYGQLVAAVAHEVRHPVFALQAATYVLREKLAQDGLTHAQLRTLESETNRLNVLMSDLLDFARPPELNLSPATAAELFGEAADVFRSEGHAGVQVAMEIEPRLPALAVDRFRLVQALLNLMRNAVNHAQGLTRITLVAHRPPDGGLDVRLSVKDDGAGIRPDILARIFEPFVTSGKGTGLGLSIARRVATAHGGRVSVESAEGRGTAFHIDLPAGEAAGTGVSESVAS
jgi:ligand-binding sensor domain-containing protein/signal transduction histidine kinase